MKVLLIIPVISIFLGCGFKISKLVRKEIQTNDITLKWYYYSYITSGSPDIVEVEKDGEIKEIYKRKGVILDVSIKEHNILLKLVAPSKGYPSKKGWRMRSLGIRSF